MEDISSQKKNENKLAAAIERERQIWRLILSILLALVTAGTGYRIGEGWRLFRYMFIEEAYYIDVFWSIVMFFAVMEWTYSSIRYFDEKEPWHKSFLMRINVITITIIVCAMLFMEFFDRLYIQMTDRSLLRLTRNVLQMPLSFIFSMIFSLSAVILSMKDEYYASLNLRDSQSGAEDEGKKTISFSDEENFLIAIVEGQKVFFKDIEVNLITHQDGINKVYDSPEHYYENNLSLKKLHEHLDGFQYRKVNRNCVVSRSIIVGYHPNADKGITLQLSEGYPTDVFVSKTEVESFLAWMEKEKE